MSSPMVSKVVSTIKLLKKLSENEYESEQCLEFLKKIDNSYSEEKASRMEIAKAMVELNYIELTLKLLKYYTRKNFFENEQTWPCLFYLLRSIWNYSDVYSEIALAATCILPILLDFLSAEDLLQSEEEDEKLYKLTLNIMNNIAHQPETKVIFQQYQASKILRKISNIENEHLKVLVYLILAQIVNENEFDKLNDPSSEVIESISNYIKESLKKDKRYKGISTSEYMGCLARLAVTKENKAKIIENGMLAVFKTILTNSNANDELSSTLTCIWNLCFDEKICDLLRKEKEMLSQIAALKNNSPSDDIQRKAAGILFTTNDLLKKPKPEQTSPNRQKHGGLDTSTTSNVHTQLYDKQKSHIMISYNSSSREMCLRIKDELKARGFSVWIDVEQIYGSTLATMADAVENAAVFLMCVSEKYYQSPNCRLEAEYAVRLQKPIIPLIMQADYMPLGWLGIIIGGKIYYKFAAASGLKLNFEQVFGNMLKEINRYFDEPSSTGTSYTKLNKSRQSSVSTYSTSAAHSNNPYNNNLNGSDYAKASLINNYKTVNGNDSSKIIDWSNKDVKHWLNSLNLSPSIMEANVFDNINGHLLKELNEIKKTAPEFFYSLLRSKLNVCNNQTRSKSNNDDGNSTLYDLLKFSSELGELFKSHSK